MNIVPQLNLNKHPRTCAPNSLVDCRNMMFDVEKGVMSNENDIYSKFSIVDLNNIISGNGEYEEYVDKIIYILGYDCGFIIFARDVNGDWMYLFNYDEIEDELNLVYSASYSYNNGSIVGTHFKNRNGELIIAYSEFDGDYYSPIKTININNPTDDKYNTLCPEVIIPKVNFKFYKSKWYKGENTFFIRFKINEYDYTQWFPLHISIITSAEEIRLINDFRFYTLENPGDKNLKLSDHKLSNSVIVDKENDFADYSIKLTIDNIQYYEFYQIGVITSTVDGNKAFKSFDISSSELIWILNIQNVETYYAQELITSYYNYYDVKELVNFKNKLYISNFKEKYDNLQDFVDKNITLSVNKRERDNLDYDANNTNVSDFQLKLMKLEYDRVYKIINKEQYLDIKYLHYIQVCHPDAKSFTDNLGDKWMPISWISQISNSKWEEEIPNANKVISIDNNSKTVRLNRGLNDIYDFENTDVRLKKIGLWLWTYAPDEGSTLNSYSKEDIPINLGSIKLKDIYLAKDNNDILRIYININYTANISSTRHSYNGKVFDKQNPLNYRGVDYIQIEILGKNYEISTMNLSAYNGDTGYSSYKRIIDYEGFNGIINAINYPQIVPTESEKDIYDKSLIPEGVYNIFIHFVDKYGIVTDGFKVSDYFVNNDSPFTLVNQFGEILQDARLVDPKNLFIKIERDDLYENIYELVVKNLSLPKGYVGWFLSYEEYQTNKLYTVYCKSIGQDTETNFKIFNLYCNELIYNNNIPLNISKMRRLLDDTEIDVSNSIKVLSGLEYENVGYSCCLRPEKYYDLYDGYWYNVYSDNIYYQSKYKTLIPISQISYENNITNDNEKIINGNYNGVFTVLSVCAIKMPVVYNEADFSLRNLFATGETYRQGVSDGYTEYNFLGQFLGYIDSDNVFLPKDIDTNEILMTVITTICTDHFDELKNINIEPKIIIYPIAEDGESLKDDISLLGMAKGVYTDYKDYVDLYRYKYHKINESYPKKYINYDKDIQLWFNKTIRRSNVISDESLENSWRKFDAEQYINIKENKGNIVKITSVVNTLIIHTEGSVFQFDYNDRLASNGDVVQVEQKDIFDTRYIELFNSELGLGGLKEKSSCISGDFGYIWYCEDSKCFYSLSEKGPKDISTTINGWLNRVDIKNIHFGDDKYRKRLLIKFDVNDVTSYLSFNYATSTFVSLHDYINDTENVVSFANTKNSIYLITDTFICKFHSNTYVSKFKLSIINNVNFDDVKFIEYIQYIITKIQSNSDNIIDIDYLSNPVMGDDGNLIPYSGDELVISSEETITDIIDLKTTNETNKQHISIDKPYYELGKWNFNKIVDKRKNRMFGKYFISSFKFDRSNIDDDNKYDKIEFESINVALTKYRK